LTWSPYRTSTTATIARSQNRNSLITVVAIVTEHWREAGRRNVEVVPLTLEVLAGAI
jgi:hypothetical protein